MNGAIYRYRVIWHVRTGRIISSTYQRPQPWLYLWHLPPLKPSSWIGLWVWGSRKGEGKEKELEWRGEKGQRERKEEGGEKGRDSVGLEEIWQYVIRICKIKINGRSVGINCKIQFL